MTRIFWLLIAGCTASTIPDSGIRDVRPLKIEQGIRVLVEGKGFEAGQPAEVMFKGEFVRRGGKSEAGAVKASGRAVASDRVIFDVDDEFERRTGRADFTGVVTVTQGDKQFVSPPQAPFRLEFFPPSLRQLAYGAVQESNARSLPFNIPEGLLLVAVPLAAGLLLIMFLAPFSGLVTVAERRIAGRMQSRIGPNRVGPQGLLQWLADAFKLITKEDLIPTDSDPILFRIAPYLVWIGVFATFVVLPFSQAVIVADMNVGILYLLSITALVVVGIIMGGWASNSKWSLLGGMRSAAQIVSYEVPAALAILSVVLIAGTLSPQNIVKAQGGAPWSWFMFYSPFSFAAFFIYFISALAEGNRTPFDLPEAESELVSGYNTEYSGFRFSVFFLAEWTNLYVIAAVATTVFLGGWRLPMVSPLEMEASILLQLAGFAVFFMKALALVFVIIWVRWTVPRFRVDQMMALCWKYLIPLTFATFIGTALWVWLVPDWAMVGSRYVLFAIGGVGLAALFIKRVLYNLGNARRRLWDISGALTPPR